VAEPGAALGPTLEEVNAFRRSSQPALRA
jgi:hypothetical protein